MSSNDEFRTDELRTDEFRTDEFRTEELPNAGRHPDDLGTLSRPSGPSWGTVALGLVCLVVAGGALWVSWADLDLDWARSGPLTLVGLGVILVLVGLVALVRRSDDDGPDQ